LHSGEYQDSSAGSFSLYCYQNDPNGCPVRLLSSTGEVLWAASYTAWADIDLLHAAVIDNPIRLQGQYADAETGLSYNRHRYFCPHAGQFVSQDPLGRDPWENLYEFGLNTLEWIDPLGLSCKPTKFHKRTVAEVKALREAFDKSGGAREKFLKALAKEPGAVKKYGSEAVEQMKKGKVPDNMVVHHKKPLFRGGTNKKSNLTLMDKTDHSKRNKELHWYPEGQNPFGLN
jgi:RHS repeat-associated protein